VDGFPAFGIHREKQRFNCWHGSRQKKRNKTKALAVRSTPPEQRPDESPVMKQNQHRAGGKNNRLAQSKQDRVSQSHTTASAAKEAQPKLLASFQGPGIESMLFRTSEGQFLLKTWRATPIVPSAKYLAGDGVLAFAHQEKSGAEFDSMTPGRAASWCIAHLVPVHLRGLLAVRKGGAR